LKGKALLVLVPLLSIAGLLVLPALATPTYPAIEACGWAWEKASWGCVSGCATLYVAVGTPGTTDGVVPAFDTLTSNYVVLFVQSYAFEWVICPSSVTCKCNILTFTAYPYGVADPSEIQWVTPLSPIFVTIDLCKPYFVTAIGCSTLFVGQWTPVTPVTIG